MQPLHKYRIFDLLLASNQPLPELPEWNPTGAAQPPELRVAFAQTAAVDTAQAKWDHHWRETDGTVSLSLARSGAAFILRAHSVADFRVNESCNNIEICARPDTSPALLRHLLLDQIMPRVVAQRGRTVLHASAVSVNNSTVAIMGASGAGKSTIASWLYQKGHTLLCDDCLALESACGKISVVPSYAGARLWDDSPALSQPHAATLSQVADYSDKLRWQLNSSVAQKPRSVKALLVLEPQPPAAKQTVQLSALTGVDAVLALVQHSFQLDMTDTGRTAANLETLSAMVNRGLPIYRLCYPHTAAALADLEHQLYTLLPGATNADANARSVVLTPDQPAPGPWHGG